MQYDLSVIVHPSKHALLDFKLLDSMSLEQFGNNTKSLLCIAESHANTMQGDFNQLTLPFFCTRLSLKVLQEVGEFDESFGPAGGEDFDYCLRAWKMGFKVGFALRSYILHFGGRSSWTQEENAERVRRESAFIQRFKEKWGDKLQHFAFNFNEEISVDDSEIADAVANRNFTSLVRKLSDNHD